MNSNIISNEHDFDDESEKTSSNECPANAKGEPNNNEQKENKMNADNPTEAPSNPKVEETDFSKFRLSQDFASQIGVEKVVRVIPVRKPSRQEFVRVHPDETWRMETAIIEIKDEREIYLVTPQLLGELSEFATPVCLFTTISRQKVLTLWPVKLPGTDGRSNPWHESALDAANLAKDSWVRVSANMSLGAYDVVAALGDIPDPEWPGSDMDFNGLLKIAFRGHIIDSMDHPIVKLLLGAA